jgi:hypothetical protein
MLKSSFLSVLVFAWVWVGLVFGEEGGASWSPKFEVYETNKLYRKVYQAKVESQWDWTANTGGRKRLAWVVKVTSPAFKKYKAAVAKSSSTIATLKDDVLELKYFQMTESVQLLGPESPALKLELRSLLDSTGPAISKDCSTERIFFNSVSSDNAKQIPVGMSCVSEGDEVFFTVSFPADVELENSTIYELEGKGEPWRTYKLMKRSSEKASLGTLVFSFKKKKYSFQIDYLPPETPTKKDEKNNRHAWGAAGLGNFKTRGTSSDATDSKLVFTAKLPFYPVLGEFGVGGLIDWSLPTQKKDASISYSQIEVYALREFSPSTTLKLRPKLGYVRLNFENDATGAGASGGQLGLGLGTEVHFENSWAIFLDIMTVKLLSKSFTSHWAVDLALVKKNAGSVGYGGGLRYQALEGTSATNYALDISQIAFQGILLF